MKLIDQQMSNLVIELQGQVGGFDGCTQCAQGVLRDFNEIHLSCFLKSQPQFSTGVFQNHDQVIDQIPFVVIVNRLGECVHASQLTGFGV